MITGYNNDIKHRGTVFHVQTEDKGVASAWIESLIYTGGRILARKRVTYKQLLDQGADKPAIAKLMERQHRLMIRQIRDGRFDSETSEGVAPGVTAPTADESEIHTARIQQQAAAMFAPPEDAGPEEPAAPPLPAAVAGKASAPEAPPPEDLLAAAEASAREQPATPAAPPPPATPETPTRAVPGDEKPRDEVAAEGPAPTLDQVIFDYLSSVAKEESLVLLMDESPALASNTTTRMDLGTHASRSGKPIARAVIAVRMISKMGAPVTLAEGTTNEDGTLQLVVDVPEVPMNSAALIITANSSIGNAEIKHLL